MTPKDYLADAVNFTSNRRLLFIRMFQDIGRELGLSQPPEGDVVHAMEYIHASATIVDDMLDNECLRKELPSYYVRHGSPVAAFAALNLMVRGIEALGGLGVDLRAVLKTVRRMVDAEEADVGLKRRPPDTSPLEWYAEIVSVKIACELLLILDLSLQDAPAADSKVEDLRRSTLRLGRLIQFCDDWYDLLVRDPFALIGEGGEYVLTYSLPLALYMREHGDEFERFLGERVERGLAREMLGKVSAAPVRSAVERFIEAEHGKLVKSLRNLPPTWAAELGAVADAVRSPQYWEKKYYELA